MTCIHFAIDSFGKIKNDLYFWFVHIISLSVVLFSLDCI